MSAPRPYTLVAELTYRCPFRCPYCSNPLDYARHTSELDTAAWVRLLSEAEELGVVQVNFTGGEPLVREDLEALVARAREVGLYSNLITGGVPLERARLARLRGAGLDAVQLSVQDAARESSDHLAGLRSFDRKLEVAAWCRELGFPLTLNVVLHRENIGNIPQLVALAETMGAERLELANTQYLGWAQLNRRALLPTAAQIELARAQAAEARERLRGRMEILFVLPDYHAGVPRACMDGWARRFIVIGPEGLVLPCHVAQTLPGLQFESARSRPLGEIWRDSPGLNRFRGEGWMSEPCRSCDQRTIDFGGCRCQAMLLTGDAARTDPACALSPDHGLIAIAREEAHQPVALTWRTARLPAR